MVSASSQSNFGGHTRSQFMIHTDTPFFFSMLIRFPELSDKWLLEVQIHMCKCKPWTWRFVESRLYCHQSTCKVNVCCFLDVNHSCPPLILPSCWQGLDYGNGDGDGQRAGSDSANDNVAPGGSGGSPYATASQGSPGWPQVNDFEVSK